MKESAVLKPVFVKESKKDIDLILSIKESDWDFSNDNVRDGTHSIHPYPAKFIPNIPRNLIKFLYQVPDTYVLDPFCGCGTTLVECMYAQIPSVGIDLHPLATLITKVKTSPVASSLIPFSNDIISKCKNSKYDIPDIPNLDHWFQPSVQEALAGLTVEINKVHDSSVRDALKVALSSIIVRVSNQDSDTRYAAVQKDVSADQVYKQFENAVALIDGKLGEVLKGAVNGCSPVKIINKDVLKVEPHELPKNISLVITSPPYPNAYEYWLYHKYRMYWLGMDPIEVKNSEIGARPHYFKKNHQTEADFEMQMERCFWLFSEVMIKRGKVCFLVGSSVIHGRTIDNVEILIRAGAKHGFKLLTTVCRSIPDTRKTFNPKNGRINQETLVVFSL